MRPKIDFQTSMDVWRVDELIKRRVRDWRRLTGEDGHTGTRAGRFRKDHYSVFTGTYSVFPIPLMEWIILRYAGEPGSRILDAFAGGPPRAIASSIMGHEYVGFEIRQEQIDENKAVLDDLGLGNVSYVKGDARFLDGEYGEFDCAITCPPYFNLEVYSDHPDDVSTFKTYDEFDYAMYQSACAHIRHMKPGSFVCIVVGNFRDKKTAELMDLRGHTVQNFTKAGFKFWQDVVLVKNFGSAAKRAANAWKGQKLVPLHEYLLVFQTPERKKRRRVRL